MNLLLVTDGAAESFIPNFQRLPALFGHKVRQIATPQRNTANIEAACRKLDIGGILINTPLFLEAALNDTPDFIRANNRKLLTLDDYAGSYLDIRQNIPAVVLNPLDRLITIPYERFVVDRYISKLTKPGKWFPQTEFKWKMVGEDDVEFVRSRLEAARLVGVDIETPGDSIRSISCISYTGYFPGTAGAPAYTESYAIGFDEYWQYAAMRLFNDTAVAKVFQNGLYDCTYFLRWNAPVRNWLHDTQHLFHSWLSELPKRLDFLATFALRKVRFWKEDGKTGRFEDLCRYCCMDSWVTVNAYFSLLAECPHWAVTNYLQEFPLVFPAITAALEGMPIDEVKFKEVRVQKEKEVESIRGRISNLLSIPYEYGNKKLPGFNPNSSAQVMNLFKLLGVGYLGSTDEAAMLKARATHPLNDYLLGLCVEYRQAAKLVSNYFKEDSLWGSVLFYAFNPAATDSGRLNSTASAFWCGFQIQNIPNGDILKQCMVAPPGWSMAEADKAQSEARCVGYLSGDKNLIALVESEHDYHSWNAAAFFGMIYEEIYDEKLKKTLNKLIRDLSKRTNHGANYNMGARVMLDTMGPKMVATAKRVLKLPANWSLVAVCEYLLKRYAATYPDVKGTWYEYIVNTIEMTGMLISPDGWVRKFHGKPRGHKPTLNAAVAHGPQHLSVSVINKEWYTIWRETIYGTLRGQIRIKAQIHDSLLFIYRELKYAHVVHGMMQSAIPVTDARGVTRSMKIPTDLSVGKHGAGYAKRWSELK